MKHIYLSLAIIATCLTAKAQQIPRISGISDTTLISSLEVDTTKFYYTDGKGYNTKNEPLFDSALTRSYNFLLTTDSNHTHLRQQYDASGNLTVHTYRTNQNGAGWQDSLQYLYSYDGQGTLIGTTTRERIGGTLENTFKDSSAFLPSNKPAYYQTWVWNGSSWVNDTRVMYYYDQQGRDSIAQGQYWFTAGGLWLENELVTTTFSNDTMTVLLQFYNGSVYEDNRRIITSLNAANQPVTEITQFIDLQNNLWENFQKDTSTYNAAGDNTIKSYYTWDSANAQWQLIFRDSAEYNASHARTLLVTKTVDGPSQSLVNYRRQFASYNSFNQPTDVINEQWIIGSGWFPSLTGSYRTRYYYDEVYSPANVANTTGSQAKLLVYPQPAGAYANMRVEWAQPQAFTISISDMQGRVLRQWAVAATSHYEERINTAQLAAGNYFIMVNSKSGKQAITLNVVK